MGEREMSAVIERMLSSPGRSQTNFQQEVGPEERGIEGPSAPKDDRCQKMTLRGPFPAPQRPSRLELRRGMAVSFSKQAGEVGWVPVAGRFGRPFHGLDLAGAQKLRGP